MRLGGEICGEQLLVRIYLEPLLICYEFLACAAGIEFRAELVTFKIAVLFMVDYVTDSATPASNSCSTYTLSQLGSLDTILLNLRRITSLGLSSSFRWWTTEFVTFVVFRESKSGELTMSFSMTSFDGLHETEFITDYYVVPLIIVALVVVTFYSFSEHRVLLDKQVLPPILIMFFLKVKLLLLLL